MGEFLRDRAIFVYDFWNGVLAWFRGHPLPGWLSFLDPFAAGTPVWKTFLIFALDAVVYLAVCLLMVKIAKIPLAIIDRHMRGRGANIGLNMPLYIIAIGLILFDELTVGGIGRQSDGKLHIGLLTIIAGLLLIISVFRMMRRAGLRFIYFIPLQTSVFALFYLYILLFAPAAVILFALAVTGASFTAPEPGVSRYVCPHCGGEYSPGVACSCGRSVGSYDGYRFPRSND